MMINYKIVPNMEYSYINPTYDIVETQTYTVVKNEMQQLEAKQMCRQLNFGAGFDGFTPTFFLEKLSVNNEPSFYCV